MTKITSTHVPVDSQQHHIHIQALLVRTMKEIVGEICSTSTERLRLYENDLEALKSENTVGNLESISEYRRVILEMNNWIKSSKGKYTIAEGETSLLPSEPREKVALTTETERIKSFLFVKNQREVVRSMERLEKTMEVLQAEYFKKCYEVDRLRRHEDNLQAHIHTLKNEISERISAMAKEHERVPMMKQVDKLAIFENVQEEINMMNANSVNEYTDLLTKNQGLERKLAEMNNALVQTQKKMVKKIVVENKGVQAYINIEDVVTPRLDDIQSYFDNPKYFTLGGVLRGVDWATYLITDIFASKVVADSEDIRNGYFFLTQPPAEFSSPVHPAVLPERVQLQADVSAAAEGLHLHPRRNLPRPRPIRDLFDSERAQDPGELDSSEGVDAEEQSLEPDSGDASSDLFLPRDDLLVEEDERIRQRVLLAEFGGEQAQLGEGGGRGGAVREDAAQVRHD